MGYHITLLRSPPRPILWEELAAAARALGWDADAPAREVRLEREGALQARVLHGQDGEPWCKLTGDAELAHVIGLADALGARARGDEFESYRRVDDWYVHPDDRKVRDAIAAASDQARAKRAQRKRLWDGFRIVVLLICVAVFGVRIWADLQ
jgi:hypothetical protein